MAYGFLLALNTTFPLLADLTGEKVTVAVSGDAFECTLPLAKPPYAGIYGHCDVQWSSGGAAQKGRLVGPDLESRVSPNKAAVPAAVIKGIDYAFISPAGLERVAGFAAPIIFLFGLVLLLAKKRRSHRGHRSDHDSDDDDDDESDTDGGDSDGGGDGGGGD